MARSDSTQGRIDSTQGRIDSTQGRIVLPGGSGQVGTILARAFHAAGREVVVLSRHPAPAPWRVVEWDGRTPGGWCRDLEGADAVINLAGRSVNSRYTPANRRRILDSRVDSTRAIGAAINQASQPPRVWLQAGTSTIYAHRYDAPNDEANGKIGGDQPGSSAQWGFSVQVAREWERACEEADTPATRKVILRSSMTMSPDRGGVFATLLGLVRLGLGGQAGDGRQYVSWIHDADFVRAIVWLLDHPNLAGPVNITAPSPLPNADLMRDLRHAAGVPVGLPATRWMLAIGTALLRTESELILKSRRVIPSRLAESGFEFEFPIWPAAVIDLCARWKVQPTALPLHTRPDDAG